MLIKYFIPEDGDDQSHPNVFELNIGSNKKPTLADIRSSFPLDGVYHFRCLSSLVSHIVWLDLTEDQSVVASHNGAIFLKVSRIFSSTTTTPSSSVQRTASPPFKQTETASASAFANDYPSVVDAPPTKPPKITPISPKESLLSFGDDDTIPIAVTGASNHQTPSSAAHAASADASLISVDYDNDLLGMSNTSSSAPAPLKATISSDFLGLDAPLKPTKAPVNAMGGNAAMKTPTVPSVSMGAMGSGNSMNPMNNNNNSFNGMGVGMAGSSSGGRPMGGVAINNSGYSSSGMMNPLQTSKAGGGNSSYDPFNSIDVMSGKSISSNNNNNKSSSTYISSQQQQQQGKR